MNGRNITKSLLIAGLIGALAACAGVTPAPQGEVNLLALTPVDGPVATTMRDAGFTFQTKGDPSTLDGVVVDGDYATAKDITAFKSTIRSFLAQKKLVLFLDTQKGVHVGGISSVLGLSSRGDHSGIAYRQVRKGRLQEFRLSFKDGDANDATYLSAQTLRYVKLLKERLKSNSLGDESYCATDVPDGLAHVCFTSEAIQNNDVLVNGTTVPRTIGLKPVEDSVYWNGFGDSTYFEDKNYLLSKLNPSTVAVDVYYDNRNAAVGGSWFYLQSKVQFSGYGVVDPSTKGWHDEPALATLGENGPVVETKDCLFNSGTTDVYFNGPYFMGMGYRADLKNADGSAINPSTYGLLQVVPSNTNNQTTVDEDITTTVGFTLGTSTSASSSHTTSTTVTNSVTNWRILNKTGAGALNVLYLSQNPPSAPLGFDKLGEGTPYSYDPDLERYFSFEGNSEFGQRFSPNVYNVSGTNLTFSSAALWRVRANQDQAVIGSHLVLSPSVWFKYQTYTHYGWAFCDGPTVDPSSAFKVNPNYFSDIDMDLNQVVELNLPFTLPAGTSYQMNSDGTLSVNGSVNIGARKDIPQITVSDPSSSGAKYAVTQPTSCTPTGDCAFQVNVSWSPPAGASTTVTVQAKGLGFTNQVDLSLSGFGSR